MHADEQLCIIRSYLNKQEPTLRLSLAVKLYFAYFLAIDELQAIYDQYRDDFNHPDSNVIYRATLDWFAKFSQIEISNFDVLLNAPRPFIWKYDVLNEEFKDLMETIPTLWVTNEEIDYSNGIKLGDSPLHQIDWYEERGMIEVDGVLISRSIQPVLIGQQPSEKIVVAMPRMTQQEFTDKFDIIPAMGGGCAFKAVYGPAQLDINYADAVGIDDVDSAMVCVGKLVEDEKRNISIEDLPKFDYFSVKRTLKNGVEVPFIR